MLTLLTALCECCRICTELPDAATTLTTSDNTFHRPGAANLITIYPRLRNGAPAAYIYPDDVQLTVFDANYGRQRVHVRMDIARHDHMIALRYTLGDECDPSILELRVRVHVCGVLLVDARVREAAFDGRTAGRICGQYTLRNKAYKIAVHPAGTHLVAINAYPPHSLNVYKIPTMEFLATIGSYGSGPTNLNAPGGLCFTDAGTLLVADSYNARVQHWTLEGSCIASFVTQRPCLHVASRGDIFVTGTNDGVRVCSLEDGKVLHAWTIHGTFSSRIAAFVDAETLVISSLKSAFLYTLDGKLLSQFAVIIMPPTSLVTCADGCILMTELGTRRIRVFASNGVELSGTSMFAKHIFQSPAKSIALYKECAYVLVDEIPSHVYVFK